MKRTKRLLFQISRFSAVGIFCFSIDYLLMILLTEAAGYDYIYSTAMSYIFSSIVNYFLSKRFVFHGTGERRMWSEMSVFLILSVIGLIFNQAIMWVVVESWEIVYTVAKLLSTLVVTVYNYVTRKLFLESRITFRQIFGRLTYEEKKNCNCSRA